MYARAASGERPPRIRAAARYCGKGEGCLDVELQNQPADLLARLAHDLEVRGIPDQAIVDAQQVFGQDPRPH